MADGTISITAGSGETVDVTDISVSGSTVSRQRVVIAGNADAAGLLELPDHDAADSGPPLKIGGKAQRNSPTAVAASDRVNAWFTREGQLGVVATQEGHAIYSNDATSGGRIVPLTAFSTSALNNTSTAAVAAQASLRCYVMSAVFSLSAWTSGGYATLRDDATDIFPFSTTSPLSVAGMGSVFAIASPGTYLCRTTVNTALNIYYSGNATLKWHVAYYMAP